MRTLHFTLASICMALVVLSCAAQTEPSPPERVASTLAAICSSASLSSGAAGSQGFAGGTINWIATAGCDSGDTPTYKFFEEAPGGSWTVAQDWSTNATFGWNTSGAAPGTYYFEVWIRAQGSGATYESYADGSFTVESRPACAGATLAASPASPQATGTSITFNAGSSSCNNPQYLFFVRPPGGQWTVMRSWSPTSSFAWDTTSVPAGTYVWEVWVKDANSTATYDDYTDINYVLTGPASPCASATLTASPPSPQQTDTPSSIASVTLTAGSSSCSSPLYRFVMRQADGSWIVTQDWSTAPTWVWQTGGQNGVPGTYSFELWVKDTSSSAVYDTYADLAYTLSPPPATCTSATLGASPASPQPIGTPSVTLTAGGSSCANPLYRFVLQEPGGPWKEVQAWSPSNTFVWNTSALAGGTYELEVWVKDTSSVAMYDSAADLGFTLTSGAPSPCTNAMLAASPSSPQVVQTISSPSTVAVTASSSSCSNPLYRYMLQQLDGSWVVVQDWSSTPTYVWSIAGGTPGTYRFEVWIKDATSTSAYDTYADLYYTLSPPPPTCTAGTLSSSPTSPQPVGTPSVTFTGGTSSCGNPEYLFYVRAPGGNWTIVQNWSTTNTYVWNSSSAAAGTYYWEVWVKDATSATTSYDTYGALNFVLQ